MVHTGSYPMDLPVPNLAKGYTRQRPGESHGDSHDHGPDPDAPWRENSFLIPSSGTPAGGGYSNAGDLLRFRHALVEGKLLGPRYTAWVVTNQLPEHEPSIEGFAIGVAGGAPGVNAELELGGDYTLVVLSNLDPPSARNVARHLLGLVESIVDQP